MYEDKMPKGINPTDRKMLLSSINSGKLSHAYLFVGEDVNVNESSCSEFLAMIMGDEDSYNLNLTKIKNHNHSDILDIYPDGATIKIKQLRDSVTGFLQTSPTEGRFRVAVIHEAEKMNDASQNFLLKTIEEPPEGAKIILLSSSTESILGTILSRVTKVSLIKKETELGNADIRKFIAERMSELILEGHIDLIFTTAKALMNSASEVEKNISQKDAALENLNYLYGFFSRMYSYNTIKKTKEYTPDDFGMLAGKIGYLCNINIINIIKETIRRISDNASVQLQLESMLICILEECNAENSWNKI